MVPTLRICELIVTSPLAGVSGSKHVISMSSHCANTLQQIDIPKNKVQIKVLYRHNEPFEWLSLTHLLSLQESVYMYLGISQASMNKLCTDVLNPRLSRSSTHARHKYVHLLTGTTHQHKFNSNKITSNINEQN